MKKAPRRKSRKKPPQNGEQPNRQESPKKSCGRGQKRNIKGGPQRKGKRAYQEKRLVGERTQRPLRDR